MVEVVSYSKMQACVVGIYEVWSCEMLVVREIWGWVRAPAEEVTAAVTMRKRDCLLCLACVLEPRSDQRWC